MRIRVKIEKDRVLVAGITLFHTRIKGLTSLVWLPKIGKTTNLETLKFEARASHSSGQILAGFLRLSFHNFLQMTRLVKAFYSKGIYGQTYGFRWKLCVRIRQVH